MALVALVTGASSGFGRMIARDLAGAGHIAYASMRDADGKNVAEAARNADYARQHRIDLRTITLDVQDESSVAAAVGAFTTRTNHFANAGSPDDTATAGDYTRTYPDRFADAVQVALAGTVPAEADPGAVGRAGGGGDRRPPVRPPSVAGVRRSGG